MNDFLKSANHVNTENLIVGEILKYLRTVRAIISDEEYERFITDWVNKTSAVSRRLDMSKKYNVVGRAKENHTANLVFPWNVGAHVADKAKLRDG